MLYTCYTLASLIGTAALTVAAHSAHSAYPSPPPSLPPPSPPPARTAYPIPHTKTIATAAFSATAVDLIQGVQESGQRRSPLDPKWLYENGLSTHGVWHVAVFLVAYNAATILHYLETPNAVWVCPSRRVPWLLFRVTVAHEEVGADVEAQKDKVPLFDDIDLVSPPRVDSRVHRRSRSEPPVIELAAAVRLRDSPSGSPERARPSLDVV